VPPWPARGEARAGLAAAAAALDEPIARAAEALSLLRLASPPLGPRAAEALVSAEAALEAAARRTFALAEAGRGGAARALDLAALAAELVASFTAPPGVRVRLEAGPVARAHADDRLVRAALREILTAAAAASSPGGEIAISARAGPSSASIELRVPARVPAGGLSLARALVAPQGGRVEQDGAPGQGALVRISLACAALETAV
jgi:signal transduction histidine kinase